jgi:hypothetical protein
LELSGKVLGEAKEGWFQVTKTFYVGQRREIGQDFTDRLLNQFMSEAKGIPLEQRVACAGHDLGSYQRTEAPVRPPF